MCNYCVVPAIDAVAVQIFAYCEAILRPNAQELRVAYLNECRRLGAQIAAHVDFNDVGSTSKAGGGRGVTVSARGLPTDSWELAVLAGGGSSSVTNFGGVRPQASSVHCCSKVSRFFRITR